MPEFEMQDDLLDPNMCAVVAFSIAGHKWVIYWFADEDLHPESPDDRSAMIQARELQGRLFDLMSEYAEYDLETAEDFSGVKLDDDGSESYTIGY
jgi:hypothetical protein